MVVFLSIIFIVVVASSFLNGTCKDSESKNTIAYLILFYKVGNSIQSFVLLSVHHQNDQM